MCGICIINNFCDQLFYLWFNNTHVRVTTFNNSSVKYTRYCAECNELFATTYM